MLALRTQVTRERADKEKICQDPPNVGTVSLWVINNISPGQWERTLRERENLIECYFSLALILQYQAALRYSDERFTVLHRLPHL